MLQAVRRASHTNNHELCWTAKCSGRRFIVHCFGYTGSQILPTVLIINYTRSSGTVFLTSALNWIVSSFHYLKATISLLNKTVIY